MAYNKVYPQNGQSILAFDTNQEDVIEQGFNDVAYEMVGTTNTWVRSLGSNIFAAHKGFNGNISADKENGVYPVNTEKSFSMAGELGYKVIETDVQILGDGTWVILHDENTGTRLSGNNSLLIDIDLNNFKSRYFVKEYNGYGAFWNYDEKNSGFKPLTFREFLLIAKKYNMFVMPEIKWNDNYTYKEEDFKNYAQDIIEAGMEYNTIVFSSNNNFVQNVMKYTPNSIACSFYSENFKEKIMKHKNHMLSVSVENFTPEIEKFCKDNSIPINVWTVDDYTLVEPLLKRGVNLITTNNLIYDLKSEYGLVKKSYDTKSLFENGSTQVSNSEISFDGNVLTYNIRAYGDKVLTIRGGLLKIGDIIQVSADCQVNSNNSLSHGRIYVNNNKTSVSKREIIDKFYSSSYERKTINYFVNGEETNIFIGVGGSSAGTDAEIKIRNVDIKIISNKPYDDGLRYGSIYVYNDRNFRIRNDFASKGIKNIGISDDNKTLDVEYEEIEGSKNPLTFIQVTNYSDYSDTTVRISTDVSIPNTVRLLFYRNNENISDITTGLRMGFHIMIRGN